MLTLTKFRRLTRFEQSLFGLPFVLTGALLPFLLTCAPFSLIRLIFAITAFFCARISGMAFNQLLDRHIDAKNPRTANRPLPSGLVTPKEASQVAWRGLILFLLFAHFLGPLCVLLALPAAFLICIYSYMKRYHASCHFIIGTIHFLAPVMAYAALKGDLSFPPLLIGAVAFFALTGNEMIYAIQDLEFDRKIGLHSIPVVIGKRNTILFAGALHLCSVLSLIAFGIVAHLGVIYYGAPLIALCAFVLFYVYWERDQRAFFLSTVAVSFSTMLFTFLAFL